MSELRTNKIVPRDGIPDTSSGTRNGGGILQVVYAQKKDTQTITSPTAGADIDISGLSFTIKPSRSSSLILLQATIHHFVDGGNQMGFILKANNSTITDALGDAAGTKKRVFASGQGNQDIMDSWVLNSTSFSYLHAPATTSALLDPGLYVCPPAVRLKVVFVPLNCDCKSSSLIKLPCVNCLPMYGIWVHSPPFFIFILSRDFYRCDCA